MLYLLCPITTIAYHVPRNIALDELDADSPAAQEAWASWHSTWTAGNHVRTLACAASAVAFALRGLGVLSRRGQALGYSSSVTCAPQVAAPVVMEMWVMR